MRSLVPVALAGALVACRPDPAPYDVLILHARVVDGTGTPWYRGDIAVRGAAIVAVGHLNNAAARRRIDAADRVVTPGFIDMMAGASLPLARHPASAWSKLTQGITTIMVGEGDSPAPQNGRTLQAAGPGADSVITWRSYADYFPLLERAGVGVNVIHNVGAAQVRLAIVGEAGRAPTPLELLQMKRLVAEAMRDGAVGLSTALIYPPGTYATTDELVALAQVAASYGGVYFSHMRNESYALLDAIREVIAIGERAHIPVHVYHLKAAGQENWDLMPRALALMQEARDRGVDITADVYPYVRNGIGLGSFLHPRHYAQGAQAFLTTLKDPAVRRDLRREVETTTDWENWYRHVGQDWDNVLIVDAGAHGDPRLVGRSVLGAARLLGQDVWDTFFDLVAQGDVGVNPQSMNEEQKRQAYRAPFVMVDTDAPPTDPLTAPSAHPRAFGTFPRILAKYVREEHVLPLEDAVHKMTALAADRLQLFDRGRIAPGMKADLVIFDPDSVQDLATDAQPLVYSKGIDYVLVNGVLAIDNGKPTGARAGWVLRHH